jgi:hypothetical protein
MAWILCITGTLFCLSGAYMFHKNSFEENGKLLPPVIVMITGVVLIAWGTAKFFHLS